jgi:AcrR family transcriptional regulator
MATQGERRAETRERLLFAAAELFAERGIEGSAVDAIAERAERTSGAVYDHFGGKPGLLFALLGLEMMRRIDPEAIDTETAVAALRGAVGATRREVSAT